MVERLSVPSVTTEQMIKNAGPLKQLAMAFAAGPFIAFGAVLSVAFTTDVDSVGISRLLRDTGTKQVLEYRLEFRGG